MRLLGECVMPAVPTNSSSLTNCTDEEAVSRQVLTISRCAFESNYCLHRKKLIMAASKLQKRMWLSRASGELA